MTTIIAKNQTGSVITLKNLAVDLPASGQATISDFNAVFEIQADPDLYSQISDGNVILNIDGVDLSQEQSSSILEPVSGTHALKDKLDATASPTVNDDSSSGYSVGSVWTDLTNDEQYICLDATNGAAVWKQTTANGDVTGPASSTDEAVARFDGTGGKTLQNSGVTISNSNNVSTPGLFQISGERMNGAIAAYDSAGSQTFTSGAVTVNIDATAFTPSSNLYTLSADQITVLVAGRYLVSYQTSLTVSSSSSRTQADAWLENNSTEIPGTRSTLYCRSSNYGATGSSVVVLDLAANDVIRLRAQRTNGSATLSPDVNGSRITIVRLS